MAVDQLTTAPATRGGSTIAFDRRGSGEVLLLIHCIGLDRRLWDPLVPWLAGQHELLIIDLPGHGESPAPPDDVPPTPIGYAAILSDWLTGLGLDAVHVAGYSVGGWTALELAKRERARSVTALAPVGLWSDRMPVATKAQLLLDHHVGRVFRPLLPHVLRRELGRRLAMRRTVAHPERVPADASIRMARSIGRMPAYAKHARATTRTRFEDGRGISVPVTIAFGEKERLLPKRARRRDELPAHARWVELPGCGHLPFWDDTQLIASTILEGAGTRQDV
jgi:pimeloyl-ACP methyl ester carboxylesterase